jgi:hypothetical protein
MIETSLAIRSVYYQSNRIDVPTTSTASNSFSIDLAQSMASCPRSSDSKYMTTTTRWINIVICEGMLTSSPQVGKALSTMFDNYLRHRVISRCNVRSSVSKFRLILYWQWLH